MLRVACQRQIFDNSAVTSSHASRLWPVRVDDPGGASHVAGVVNDAEAREQLESAHCAREGRSG